MTSHHRTPIALPPITFQGTAVPEVDWLLLYSSTGSSHSKHIFGVLLSVGRNGSVFSRRPPESWTPAAALLRVMALWSTPCSPGLLPPPAPPLQHVRTRHCSELLARHAFQPECALPRQSRNNVLKSFPDAAVGQ